MIAVHLLLAIWLLANATWSILNWRDTQQKTRLYRAADLSARSMIAEAEMLLRRARSAVKAEDFKVCSECKRIVAKHETDSDGKTTCLNCLAQKVS